MKSDNQNDAEPTMSWSKWYQEAREEAASRHGLRRIPVDTWKTLFALGRTPAEAAKAVDDSYRVYGSKRVF